jgi:uncharacterized OB-fold protein
MKKIVIKKCKCGKPHATDYNACPECRYKYEDIDLALYILKFGERK